MCEVLGAKPTTKQNEEAEAFLPPWMKAQPVTASLRVMMATAVPEGVEAPMPRVGSPLLLSSLGQLPLCEGAKVGPCSPAAKWSSSCQLTQGPETRSYGEQPSLAEPPADYENQ